MMCEDCVDCQGCIGLKGAVGLTGAWSEEYTKAREKYFSYGENVPCGAEAFHMSKDGIDFYLWFEEEN